MLDLLSLLYAYNAWANGHILDTTTQLTPDQFVAKAGAVLTLYAIP